MFKFSKVYEGETVELTIDGDHLRHEELREAFLRFLRACGYILPTNATLEVFDDETDVVLDRTEYEEYREFANAKYAIPEVDVFAEEAAEELQDE